MSETTANLKQLAKDVKDAWHFLRETRDETALRMLDLEKSLHGILADIHPSQAAKVDDALQGLRVSITDRAPWDAIDIAATRLSVAAKWR